MVTQIPIILASNSPRRKELLERAGYTFTVMPSDCDEATDIRFPKDMVMELAGRKAENVYKKVCTDRAGTEAETQPFIVIGSDTVVALNGRILGKPVDYDDAYNTLNSLSGQTHNVYTGVSIMYYDGEKCRTSELSRYRISSAVTYSFQPVAAYSSGMQFRQIHPLARSA